MFCTDYRSIVFSWVATVHPIFKPPFEAVFLCPANAGLFLWRKKPLTDRIKRKRGGGVKAVEKRQRFAVNIASGMKGAEAARQAGYSAKTAAVAASRLKIETPVAKMINDLQDAVNAVPAQGREGYVKKALVLQELAQKGKQYAAALQCLRFAAELEGLVGGGGGGQKVTLTQNIANVFSKEA